MLTIRNESQGAATAAGACELGGQVERFRRSCGHNQLETWVRYAEVDQMLLVLFNKSLMISSTPSHNKPRSKLTSSLATRAVRAT